MGKKVLLAAIVLLALAGCRGDESPEYLAFIKKNGANNKIYCSPEGFLTEESMYSTDSLAPSVTVLRDPDGKFVRCAVGVDGEIYE